MENGSAVHSVAADDTIQSTMCCDQPCVKADDFKTDCSCFIKQWHGLAESTCGAKRSGKINAYRVFCIC